MLTLDFETKGDFSFGYSHGANEPIKISRIQIALSLSLGGKQVGYESIDFKNLLARQFGYARDDSELIEPSIALYESMKTQLEAQITELKRLNKS